MNLTTNYITMKTTSSILAVICSLLVMTSCEEAIENEEIFNEQISKSNNGKGNRGQLNQNKRVQVLYASNENGNYDLYSIRGDGSSEVRLTDNPGNEFYASYSPNGQSVSYVLNENGIRNIYVIPSEGGEPIQLTDDVEREIAMEWSPDGQWILYERQSATNQAAIDLFKVSVDGLEKINLTGLGDLGRSRQGVWSPDGSKIAYAQRQFTNGVTHWDIFISDSDGTNILNLTADPDHDQFWPQWKNDSTIYVDSYDTGNGDVYSYNINAGTRSLLISSQSRDFGLDLSHNRKKYLIERDKRYWVYDDADGSERSINNFDVVLNNNQKNYWSKNSKYVGLMSRKDGGLNVYLMTADGENINQLTNGTHNSVLMDIR